LDPDSVIMTSAKKQIGIEDVMHAIVDRLPPPLAFSSNPMNSHHSSSSSASRANVDRAFHGRIVDSWFDEHRGVVCLVQVVGGQLKEGQVRYASRCD